MRVMMIYLWYYNPSHYKNAILTAIKEIAHLVTTLSSILVTLDDIPIALLQSDELRWIWFYVLNDAIYCVRI